METIWKFEIAEITDRFTLEMPVGAVVLTVQTQNETPCLWATVDSEREKEKRYFEIVGTGNPFPQEKDEQINRKYIGTFQLFGGRIVFHLFERTS